MKISVRFTAAVHTLLCIALFEKTERVTSDFISRSTGVNAVIIRKILLQLQKAGMVETASGVGGSHLVKPAENITLCDVYHAINEGEDEREVFNFHPNPNPACPIGSAIHRVLDAPLSDAVAALENSLSQTTLANLAKKLEEKQ